MTMAPNLMRWFPLRIETVVLEAVGCTLPIDSYGRNTLNGVAEVCLGLVDDCRSDIPGLSHKEALPRAVALRGCRGQDTGGGEGPIGVSQAVVIADPTAVDIV